jgi:hypothetical protein
MVDCQSDSHQSLLTLAIAATILESISYLNEKIAGKSSHVDGLLVE